MENIDEIKPQNVDYEKVAGLYINNPNKMSYLLFTANKKNEEIQEINPEVTRYIHLMTSLLADYMNGSYRKIPFKTIMYVLSALIFFIKPKKTFVDKIPGVKIMREISLMTLMVKSFKKDLLHYEAWKNRQGGIEEI